MSPEPVSTVAMAATLKALENPSLCWLIFPGRMKKALLNQKIAELEVEQAVQEWKAKQGADNRFLLMLENFPAEQANLSERAYASFASAAIESQLNREAIAIEANALLEERGVISDKELDRDFMKRFYNYAGDVSEEEIQKYWGKLLANEIENPGTFSLKALAILRELTQKEAASIVELSKYLVDGLLLGCYDYFSDILPDFDKFYAHLERLNFIGLAPTINSNFDFSFAPKTDYRINLSQGSLLVSNATKEHIQFTGLRFSDVFYELLKLQPPIMPDIHFVNRLRNELVAIGCEVGVEIDDFEYHQLTEKDKKLPIHFRTSKMKTPFRLFPPPGMER